MLEIRRAFNFGLKKGVYIEPDGAGNLDIDQVRVALKNSRPETFNGAVDVVVLDVTGYSMDPPFRVHGVDVLVACTSLDTRESLLQKFGKDVSEIRAPLTSIRADDSLAPVVTC